MDENGGNNRIMRYRSGEINSLYRYRYKYIFFCFLLIFFFLNFYYYFWCNLLTYVISLIIVRAV